ncbi:MAG TPA: hypothetical protein PK528_00620 [Syntrophorhabdus sp.]|nr:hypothetical protein [Syntrophorhabdus sp.]
MRTIRVGVLSAHEGALYWVSLIRSINEHSNIIIESLHGFSDEFYRSPKNIWGRLFLRVLIYFIYPVGCMIRVLFLTGKYDAFIAVTSPFFLPSLCAFLSKKPMIYLMNDLYPEALVQKGIIQRRSLLEKVIKIMTGYGIQRSSAVVYLSEGHRQFSESEFGIVRNGYIIPPGSVSNEFDDKLPKNHIAPITFLYCGTMGLFHDTSTVLNFLRSKNLPAGCRLEFRTSGAGKEKFEKLIRNELSRLLDRGTVTLGDAMPDDEWKKKMISSQVGMIFQDIGAENVIFPSKIFSSLVAGQAILAIVSETSELGRLVSDYDCGWIVAPGDLNTLHGVFIEALNPDVLHRKRRNAFRLGHERFTIEKLAGKWIDAIHKVVAS